MIALHGTNVALFRGLLARRLALRVFMFLAALAMFPFYKFDSVENLFKNLNAGLAEQGLLFPGRYLPLTLFALPILDVPYKPYVSPADVNVTCAVVAGLMDRHLLNNGARALCVGEGSDSSLRALLDLGFSNAIKAKRSSINSMLRRGVADKLVFDDESFDFVFARGVDHDPVPALLVLEIERVLKAGGVGAVLVDVANPNPGGLIKAATPVSSFLKSSSIVHVGVVDAYTFVVFKKKRYGVSSFEYYQRPDNCHSVARNEPFMKFLEPLAEEDTERYGKGFTYLANLANVSASRNFIYIEIGAGSFVNSSILNWFLPSYPKHMQNFEIYAVDHNYSVLTSYAGRHDITFIYYPPLSGKTEASDFDPLDESSHPLDESSSSIDDIEEPELFNFIDWLKETAENGDFVVMKMNAGGVGFSLLHEMFETGAMCLVDELFLQCQSDADAQDATGADCLELFKTLRGKGVFVHQW